MIVQADTPRPDDDARPSDNQPSTPVHPVRTPRSVPEEDDPEIEKTEEQPS